MVVNGNCMSKTSGRGVCISKVRNSGVPLYTSVKPQVYVTQLKHIPVYLSGSGM